MAKKGKIGVSDALYHWSKFNTDRNELNLLHQLKEPINTMIDTMYNGRLNQTYKSDTSDSFNFAGDAPESDEYSKIDTLIPPSNLDTYQLEGQIESAMYYISSLLGEMENRLINRMAIHAKTLK